MKFNFVGLTFQTEWPRVRDEFRSICYVWVPYFGWRKITIKSYHISGETGVVDYCEAVHFRPSESIVAKRVLPGDILIDHYVDCIESTLRTQDGLAIEQAEDLSTRRTRQRDVSIVVNVFQSMGILIMLLILLIGK